MLVSAWGPEEVAVHSAISLGKKIYKNLLKFLLAEILELALSSGYRHLADSTCFPNKKIKIYDRLQQLSLSQ